MARTVICVSHSTGAGGRDLARAVAERLRYRLVDEEIVARAAESQQVRVEDLADVERRKSLLGRIVAEFGRGEIEMYGAYGGFVSFDIERQPDPKSLRGLIKKAIEETAGEGNVVIVSHAASYPLAGRDDVLRVFVTASPETRVQRLAEAEGVDTKAATKSIADNDAGRADYLKRFYGVGTELPTHYDLVVNTDVIGAEALADVVVSAAAL